MAANNVIELIIRLRDELSGDFRRAKEAVGAFNQEVGNGRRIFAETTSSLLRLGAAYIGLGAIKEVAKGFLDTAASMQQYETTLTTVLKPHARAKETLEWVKEFARTTPFEVPQLVEATTRLEAYGLSAQKHMRTLGDAAGALGKDIMAAVEMVADASQGEFERMKEFGLRAADVAKKAGFATVQEMTSSRENLAKGIEALMALLAERYAGGMEKLSGTWTGMISNLKDAWTNFKQAVMESGPFQELQAYVQGLLKRVEELRESGKLDEWARQVGGVAQVGRRLGQVRR